MGETKPSLSGAPARAARNRGRAAQIVIAIVGGIVAVSFLAGLLSAALRSKGNKQNQAVMNQLETDHAARRAQMRDQIAQGNGDPNTEILDQAVKDLQGAASQSTGKQKIALEASARATESVQTAAKSYASAYAAFNAVGGMDPAAIKKKADIAERIGLIEKLSAASKAIEATVFAAPDAYEKDLVAHGWDAKQAAAAKRGFFDSMNLPAQRKIRRADQASFEAGTRQLRLLEREWGKWHYDQSKQLVIFERQAAIAEFNKISDEISKAAADLQAAQKEALSK